MIDLPPAVLAKARLAGADDWLRELPAQVTDLALRWGLTVGETYDGGTEAYVAAVTRADGTPAVLKILVPREGDLADHEIAALRLAGGDGCATLHECDAGRGAMLLERLGPSMYDLGLPYGQRLPILCDLARQVWRPVPPGSLPTGADKGRWFESYLPAKWEQTGRPCHERTVAHALAAVGRRIAAHDEERAVLVHGDIHRWNALRAGDGFKLVDPDGLIAEPEYDLGVLMREDPDELRTGEEWDRAHWLAARTGTDATAIWEWGVAERVATGLVLAGIELEPLASEMLSLADSLAGE